MTPRQIAMGAALLFAAGLVAFGDNRPESDVAEAVERAPAAPGAAVAPVRVAAASPSASPEPAILRLLDRSTLIGADDDKMGGGANVFGTQNWTPPPPPPPENTAPPPPPPPPTAPPLPFSYLGKAASEGSWEVYLARGEKTYNVRVKDVIDGVYRVDAIAPPNLTLTYLPLNQVQLLNIGVLD
jgi:hypothetical protein